MTTNDYRVTFIEKRPLNRLRECFVYAAKNEKEAIERATDRVDEWGCMKVEVMK